MKKNLLRGEFPIFLLFLTGVSAFYFKTCQAGFVKDFTGFQWRMEGAVFQDFLICFGFPALEQVGNFFLFIFYKLFKTNGLPWFLIFSTLHAINGFLLFKIGKRIFRNHAVAQPAQLAFMAACLFVFSPYQTEAVVWKVCFNFLFSSFLILTTLWQFLLFLEKKQTKRLLLTHLFFLLALFTFELALITPFLLLTYLLFWSTTKNTKPGFVENLRKLTLPQLVFLAGYFVLNKIVLGSWVGHYGAAIHLKFDFQEIGGDCFKYFSKNLLFTRDMPHLWKQSINAFWEQPLSVNLAVLLGFLLLIGGVIFFKKLSNRLKISGLFLTFFFIALLPVSNLYHGWILNVENDRYGYLASLFFFLFLAGLLSFLPKLLRYSLFIFLLGVSLFLLNRTTAFWKHSAVVYYSLLDDFRWEKAPEIFILGCPDNFEGVYMFKDYSRKDLAVKDALKYGRGKEVAGKIYQVAQFNMTGSEDGVSVQIDSTNHLTVTFNQWGNWWWRGGIGATNYKKENYDFINAGHSYKLRLKSPHPKAVYIYSVGGKWQEIQF